MMFDYKDKGDLFDDFFNDNKDSNHKQCIKNQPKVITAEEFMKKLFDEYKKIEDKVYGNGNNQ